jgi:hypothetical protein
MRYALVPAGGSDATLVCRSDQSEAVKQLVAKLRETFPGEYT